MRRTALITVAMLFLASGAQAQEGDPEWPDAGSEEPGGPKLFPRDPSPEQYEESNEVELAVPESLAEPVFRYSWYGWRNLIGDGAALALLVSFVVTEAEYPHLLIASGVTYAVGGPIAHFTAGNWGRALISFGMRVVGPGLVGLAFFGVTCAFEDSCDDDFAAVFAAIGGGIGAFVAAGLDVGLVARHKVEVGPKIAIAPAFGAVPNGPKTFGLAVQF
jgi:hypothetical protein